MSEKGLKFQSMKQFNAQFAIYLQDWESFTILFNLPFKLQFKTKIFENWVWQLFSKLLAQWDTRLYVQHIYNTKGSFFR